MTELQTTRLGRKWTLKVVIGALVLLGFGIWGLVDATWLYPKRGEEVASYRLKEYLERADEAGQLFRASVPDPQSEFDRLKPDRRRLEQGAADESSPTGREARYELARLEWLESLAVMWQMRPDRTTIEDPRESLDELRRKWQAESPPKPLAAYDLPLQWVFTVVGFGGCIYLLVLLMRVSGTRFRWNPETKQLTLPGGQTISPADLKEVDKRKWDKFFVTLHLHSGPPVKLDLYRFDRLEEWVLEMEREAFPESDEDSAGESASASRAETETGVG